MKHLKGYFHNTLVEILSQDTLKVTFKYLLNESSESITVPFNSFKKRYEGLSKERYRKVLADKKKAFKGILEEKLKTFTRESLCYFVDPFLGSDIENLKNYIKTIEKLESNL